MNIWLELETANYFLKVSCNIDLSHHGFIMMMAWHGFTFSRSNRAQLQYTMTSSNGNIFRVTGLLCGEFTGLRYKGQWRGALMFSLTCAWIDAWVNNREAGDLRRYRAHYDVTVMTKTILPGCIEIPIMKIRRSSDSLIFIMGIPILVRRHLYIETTPRYFPIPIIKIRRPTARFVLEMHQLLGNFFA